MVERLIDFLKKNFLSGLLLLIPIVVSGWILVSFLEVLWNMRGLIPDAWVPEILSVGFFGLIFNIFFTIVALVILALFISAIGFSSKFYIGQKSIKILNEFLQKIPVLRSIHGALDQLISAISKGSSGQFRRVVLVEFPRADAWSLAFVTGESRLLPDQTEKMINLFVPTSPNPTSGFYLIVPESAVRPSNLTVEQAFKTILSFGLAQP
jgi:uncharacterized membrane protein